MDKETAVRMANDAFQEIFKDLIRSLRPNPGVSQPEQKEGSYPFIPMDPNWILNEFIYLKEFLQTEERWSGHKVRDSKFLDAGCGVGNVMLLARSIKLCQQVHGIEYFDETYRRAELLLGLTQGTRYGTHLYKDDILKFEHYNRFDVIYYYCPFSDHRLEAMFEERLEDMMKPGAILLPRLKRARSIEVDERFQAIRTPGIRLAFIKLKHGERKHTITNQPDMVFNPESDEHYSRDKAIVEKYAFAQK